MTTLLFREQVLDERGINEFASGFSIPAEEYLKLNGKTGANICALAYAAAEAINNHSVLKVSYFNGGAWNHVLLLKFSDGAEVIARVPSQKFRIPLKLQSEVATMTFARYYCEIPCPRVLAWNSSERNPVGTPYILMERARGEISFNVWARVEEPDRRKMLDNLAKLHARFARPLPFRHIGSIFFSPSAAAEKSLELSNPSLYEVRPFIREPAEGVLSWNAEYRGPPSTSLRDFWSSLLAYEHASLISKYGNTRDTVILSGDNFYWDLRGRNWTMGDFFDAHANMLTLVSKCVLPQDPDMLVPCLVSADYAFRNIYVDPNTLEVTDVVDWDSISVMPLILCTRFLEDISWCSSAPRSWYINSGGFDFVPSEKPPVPGETYDYDIVNQEYRKYYKERLQAYDARFASNKLWRMRKDPLKIQCFVTHGWLYWLQHKRWLARKARAMILWRRISGKVMDFTSSIITKLFAPCFFTSE